MKVEVGDRIRLNGNGRDRGRYKLDNVAEGKVIKLIRGSGIDINVFQVAFDCGESYWVDDDEKIEVIKRKFVFR